MKIVLTGPLGFIGSHTLNSLLESGIDVLGLSRNAPKIHHPRLKWVICDLKIKETYESEVIKFLPNCLIHTAWLGVYNAFHQDNEQYENLKIIENLIEVAKSSGIKRFIALGSQAEYGPSDRPIREDFKTEPKTKYGKAKLEAYHLSKTLLEKESMEFVWFRLFSSFGPNDNPRWLIPYVINCYLQGDRPKLTEGKQKWDFLYVKDVAEALKIAALDKFVGVYNLGSGKTLSIKNIVETIHLILKPSIPLVFGEKPYGINQSFLLQADNTNILKKSCWKPFYDFEKGIKEYCLLKKKK